MNKETSDRVRENISAEEVSKISPVPTTSYQRIYQRNEHITSLEGAEDAKEYREDHPRELSVSQKSTTTITGLEGAIEFHEDRPRSAHQRNFYSRLSLSNFLEDFKHVMSSEDDIRLRCAFRKGSGLAVQEKEPMFVIVQSSDLSSTSSKQLAIETKSNHNTDNIFAKFLNRYVIPDGFASSSKDISAKTFNQPTVPESVSRDEVLMADINLQSDHEIPIDDFDDNDSIVLAYLRNKHLVYEQEGTLLISQRKVSLMDSVAKLETIEEGGQDLEKCDLTLQLNDDSEEYKKKQ